VSQLAGPAAKNKGMALFPRTIAGRHVALSWWDRENNEGWLVLTHGVGPMREYAIGALLLDLEEPSRVIGALREPLMRPRDDERDGYVPSVAYSCGALLHGDRLLLPYGASDASVRLAVVDVPFLLDRPAADGPPSPG
jgi:predicted GH43/DUF377 family glycosyl hydrolase